MAVYLCAPRYVLGELDEDHTSIPGLADRIAEFGIQARADFWSWGRIRRTTRDTGALAVESGTATLRGAGVDPASVDALVLCSTQFPADTRKHGSYAAAILPGLGIEGAHFIGLTLHRCANLLAGVQLAESLVAGGAFRRVLVVTTDRVTDERQRMEKFALFSDGAASCLLTTGPDPGEYELVACAAAHNVHQLDWANEISADLAHQVNETLLKSAGIALSDVAGLLHANVFKPILILKEMQAGFRPAQLYTDNIARVGHCFAADPLINLVDRAAAGQLDAGRYYLLTSSVTGSRVGVLIRKVAP